MAGEPALLSALTLAGAADLLWLGSGVLARPPVPAAGEDATEEAWAASLGRGFAVSGLNPRALLLLALLPQFTARDASWPVPAQVDALGLVQVVNRAAVHSLVALGSRAVLRARPGAARVVGRLSGAAMIAVALLLPAEQGQLVGGP